VLEAAHASRVTAFLAAEGGAAPNGDNHHHHKHHEQQQQSQQHEEQQQQKHQHHNQQQQQEEEQEWTQEGEAPSASAGLVTLRLSQNMLDGNTGDGTAAQHDLAGGLTTKLVPKHTWLLLQRIPAKTSAISQTQQHTALIDQPARSPHEALGALHSSRKACESDLQLHVHFCHPTRRVSRVGGWFLAC
jgi:hypothetical protein